MQLCLRYKGGVKPPHFHEKVGYVKAQVSNF
jgi:hypothetical protein